MNKKGFTLLEVMIAVMIFSVVVGAMIPALTAVQNAARVISNEVQMGELCSRITMNAALKLSGSKILVVTPESVTFQKVTSIYPVIVLGPVESISFTDLKKMYPEIDDVFKGTISDGLKEKYKIDPTVPLKGIYFAMSGDDMLIGASLSGTGVDQFMTRRFHLETKLFGNTK